MKRIDVSGEAESAWRTGDFQTESTLRTLPLAISGPWRLHCVGRRKYLISDPVPFRAGATPSFLPN
jgi:hypothetical protein